MIYRLSLDEHREAWDRAIQRAIVHGCDSKVSHVCTEYAPDFGFESVFNVQSSSRPNTVYLVQLVVDESERTATCSCPAGSNGVVCWHAAAAALISGMLTQPGPTDLVIESARVTISTPAVPTVLPDSFDVAAAGAHIANPMAALQQ